MFKSYKFPTHKKCTQINFVFNKTTKINFRDRSEIEIHWNSFWKFIFFNDSHGILFSPLSTFFSDEGGEMNESV